MALQKRTRPIAALISINAALPRVDIYQFTHQRFLNAVLFSELVETLHSMQNQWGVLFYKK
jgi:hypothetical protein